MQRFDVRNQNNFIPDKKRKDQNQQIEDIQKEIAARKEIRPTMNITQSPRP